MEGTRSGGVYTIVEGYALQIEAGTSDQCNESQRKSEERFALEAMLDG